MPSSNTEVKPKESPIRILLVDDHCSILEALKLWLEQTGRAEVIGVAESGLEALKVVRQLQPQVILMDLAMPGLNGTETARAILKLRPTVKIIIYSGYNDPGLIQAAMNAGVSGFIRKAGPVAEIWGAIECVLRGQSYFPDAPRLVRSEPSQALTARQQEVLKCVASGMTTREIALKMSISERTVEAQRKTVMLKLNINSIAGLTQYAIASGLITP